MPARVNCALIPKAEFALRRLTGALGLSQTDVVNRALQVYDLVVEQQDQGRRLVAVDRATGEAREIMIVG